MEEEQSEAREKYFANPLDDPEAEPHRAGDTQALQDDHVGPFRDSPLARDQKEEGIDAHHQGHQDQGVGEADGYMQYPQDDPSLHHSQDSGEDVIEAAQKDSRRRLLDQGPQVLLQPSDRRLTGCDQPVQRPDHSRDLQQQVEKADVEDLQETDRRKADRSEVDRQLQEMRDLRDLREGRDSQEMDLSEYATVDHVNTALREIHAELDQKVELQNMLPKLEAFENITEALCAENCVGRWYWKSGGLKNHNGVPWEEQNINTCPENFLWEENKTSILTVAPGLYEVR